jgi:hypothetical protein
MMAVAAGVYLVLRLAGFHQLFVNDAEGMGALLEIIGTLYSVVFATYVIWGQFAAVENEILKESGALKDLILFSKGLKEATRDPIVRSVAPTPAQSRSRNGKCSSQARTASGPTSCSPESSAALPTRLPRMNPSAGRTTACWKLPIGPAGTATKLSPSA